MEELCAALATSRAGLECALATPAWLDNVSDKVALEKAEAAASEPLKRLSEMQNGLQMVQDPGASFTIGLRRGQDTWEAVLDQSGGRCATAAPETSETVQSAKMDSTADTSDSLVGQCVHLLIQLHRQGKLQLKQPPPSPPESRELQRNACPREK